MSYEIIVGRSEALKKKIGMQGMILLGKNYVTMGRTTSLSSDIYLDVATSHVVFICGKRGGGKSYTLGVVAEGFMMLPPDIKKNLSIILLDTMGIYWTMKFPNKKDKTLLEEWGLKPQGFDIQIFTPKAYFDEYKKQGVPTDYAFSINPSELSEDDWCNSFKINKYSEEGVLLMRIINGLKDSDKNFSIDKILDTVLKDNNAKKETKDAVYSMFMLAKSWGVFSDKSTPLSELARPGQVTVLDVSCYATLPGGWDIKALIIGIVSQHLFVDRMVSRKYEEFDQVHSAMNYFRDDDEKIENKEPLVWLVIDEAHEFLPKDRTTAATDALVTILREGRQPGISLILASQQPGKIHTDVMTQSDVVISHRITAKLDVEALDMLKQSYMQNSITEEVDKLPHFQGSAVVFDDANERVYPMRVRPRASWHGGSAPIAVHEKKEYFDTLKKLKNI